MNIILIEHHMTNKIIIIISNNYNNITIILSISINMSLFRKRKFATTNNQEHSNLIDPNDNIYNNYS